jgi:hypothetical protein
VPRDDDAYDGTRDMARALMMYHINEAERAVVKFQFSKADTHVGLANFYDRQHSS